MQDLKDVLTTIELSMWCPRCEEFVTEFSLKDEGEWICCDVCGDGLIKHEEKKEVLQETELKEAIPKPEDIIIISKYADHDRRIELARDLQYVYEYNNEHK